MLAAVFSSYGLAPPPPLPPQASAKGDEPAPLVVGSSVTNEAASDTYRWLQLHDHLLQIVTTDRAQIGGKGVTSSYKKLPKELRITITVLMSGFMLICVPYGIVLYMRTMSDKKDAGRIMMMVVFSFVMVMAWVFVEF